MSGLRSEIVEYLDRNPGASTSRVRRAVSAQSARVSDALSELEGAGQVRNDGNQHRHRWVRADQSGNGFGEPPASKPSSWPEEIEGVRVTRWATPKDTALSLGVSVRTLQRWEPRGFPSHGSGRRKRHPWPHAAIWAGEHARAKEAAGAEGVKELPVGLALARDRVFQLENFGGCGHP